MPLIKAGCFPDRTYTRQGRPLARITLYVVDVESERRGPILYLKNRDRDNWQGRFDYKVETDLGQLHLEAMEQLMREDQAAVIDVTPNHPALEAEPND